MNLKISILHRNSVIVLLVLLAPAYLHAQVELAGPVTGELRADTYLVMDSLFVPEGGELLIHAGSVFLFQGDYVFAVYGQLVADGTEQDSIVFRAASPDNSWHGIDFRYSDSRLSRLSYCLITQSQSSGVYCEGTSPLIEYCTLSNNINVNHRGGGIFCYIGASPHIENCVISNNFGELDGGGIGLMNECNATILNCTITNNETQFGGGIYVNGCPDAVIRDCVITGNISHYYGGGIYLYSSDVEITRCVVADNYTDRQGGGLHCRHVDVQIDHTVFNRNEAVEEGAGVYLGLDTSFELVNSIVADHENGGIYSNSEFTPELTYTDFYGNENYTISGNTPGGFGEITEVNVNGDSCDVYSNLFLDPGFVNDEALDFHLLPYSVCIDAGNPDSGTDPDGSITDIGTFPYQWQPCALVFSDSLLEFGEVFVGDSASVQLTIANTGEGFGGIDSLELFPGENLRMDLQAELPYWLYPDSSLSIEFWWFPDTVGVFESGLSVYHNDSTLAIPYPIQLVGNAIVNVPEDRPSTLPSQITLYQNAPNPFNSSTAIRYNLPEQNRIRLSVFDLLGREVAVLQMGVIPEGMHAVVFNGAGLASGVYVYQLETGKNVYQQRMVLVR